jgi:hypothetical protein
LVESRHLEVPNPGLGFSFGDVRLTNQGINRRGIGGGFVGGGVSGGDVGNGGGGGSSADEQSHGARPCNAKYCYCSGCPGDDDHGGGDDDGDDGDGGDDGDNDGDGGSGGDPDPSVVPEPGSFAVWSLAAVALVGATRRKKTRPLAGSRNG